MKIIATISPGSGCRSFRAGFTSWVGGFFHGEKWEGQDLTGFLVSEKLRGWRLLWDGQRYQTRSGMTLDVPQSWLCGMPQTPLDGELYAGRWPNEGKVRSATACGDYSLLRFHVFDIPLRGWKIEQAISVIQLLNLPDHCRKVEYRRASSTADALRMRDEIVYAGGEGVMARRNGSVWEPFRKPDLFKLKGPCEAD